MNVATLKQLCVGSVTMVATLTMDVYTRTGYDKAVTVEVPNILNVLVKTVEDSVLEIYSAVSAGHECVPARMCRVLLWATAARGSKHVPSAPYESMAVWLHRARCSVDGPLRVAAMVVQKDLKELDIKVRVPGPGLLHTQVSVEQNGRHLALLGLLLDPADTVFEVEAMIRQIRQRTAGIAEGGGELSVRRRVISGVPWRSMQQVGVMDGCLLTFRVGEGRG